MPAQKGILSPPPKSSRSLTFAARPDGDLKAALEALASLDWGDDAIFGIGATAVSQLERSVPGLRSFPVFDWANVAVPSTPAAAWVHLLGDDRGELLQRGRKIEELLNPGFYLVESVDGFKYKEGRDLTGYVDGTENPSAENSPSVAQIQSAGAGIDGGSFVSVQRWVHDLSTFASWTQEERDHSIGRRLSDNEELDDAPETAHVKRTAQESFTPEAFLVRRSMPYTSGEEEGLLFIAYCYTLDAFDAQLKRMVGAEDGKVDALFRFSTPVNGSHFFCPPTIDGKLDLSALL